MAMKRKRPLRLHQRTAFEYSQVQHPALYMEMRLGKTLVAIRRCLTYRPRHGKSFGLRVLVVAPNSALGSWEDELDTESVAWIRLMGSKKDRKETLKRAWPSAHTLPYFFLVNKEGHMSTPEMGVMEWDAVIIDESHFIKSPRAQVTKFFLKAFRDVPHRWLLTGTPNPEGDHEFFTQLAFQHDTFMGFKNFYHWQSVLYFPHPAGYGQLPKTGTPERIQKEVGKHCLVMRRKDVGVEKNKVEEVRWLELPTKERKVYDKLEKEFIFEHEENYKDTIWAGAKFQWLRQLCGGFGPDQVKVHTLKINALVDIATGELAKEQLVIWFNFNAELHEVTKLLAKKKVKCIGMTGETKPEMREKYRRSFQKGHIRVLCVQQAIAQTGMNLSASDTAIYFSQPAGYLAWKQTQDRILDLGQDSSLLLLYLVVRNSVDEDIHLALRQKGVTSDKTLTQAIKAQTEKRCGIGRQG